MIKTVARIDGMMCGMCETHINETIRKNFKVKKVTSSHKKGCSEIISEEPIDVDKLRDSISDIGYTLEDVSSEQYAAKRGGIFGRKNV